MARFRSMILPAHSGRASVTRLAHNSQTVVAQSWQGEVEVHLYRDGETDMVAVTLRPHNGASLGQSRILYRGPAAGWQDTE